MQLGITQTLLGVVRRFCLVGDIMIEDVSGSGQKQADDDAAAMLSSRGIANQRENLEVGEPRMNSGAAWGEKTNVT